MRRTNNKRLYESIMKDVSKIVKRHLNEEKNILELATETQLSIDKFLNDNELIQIMYNDTDNNSKLFLICMIKDILDKTRKTYTIFNTFTDTRKDFLNNIKNINDDIIIIEDNGSLNEYLKLLQDLFDTIDLPFSQILLLSTEDKNSLKDYVQTFNEQCNFKTLELK